jgi:hypothetical protein
MHIPRLSSVLTLSLLSSALVIAPSAEAARCRAENCPEPPEPKEPKEPKEVQEPDYHPEQQSHPQYGYGDSQKPTSCPAVAPAQNIHWAFQKSGDFGNEEFGAGYEISVGIDGVAGSGSVPATLDATGKLRASGTLFHHTAEIARVEAIGHAVSQGGATGSVLVRLGGYDLFKESRAVTLTPALNWQRDFFNFQTTIVIGPVPVSIGAGAGGNVGFSAALGFNTNGVGLTARPYANVYATASAGVGVFGFGAGIDGNLTLLEAAAPATATAQLTQNGGVNYALGLDLELAALSGRLNAYVEGFGTRHRMQIASWSAPLKTTIPVFRITNCQSQLLAPPCGDNICVAGETPTSCPADCHAPAPQPGPTEPPPNDDPTPSICKRKPWMCE